MESVQPGASCAPTSRRRWRSLAAAGLVALVALLTVLVPLAPAAAAQRATGHGPCARGHVVRTVHLARHTTYAGFGTVTARAQLLRTRHGICVRLVGTEHLRDTAAVRSSILLSSVDAAQQTLAPGLDLELAARRVRHGHCVARVGLDLTATSVDGATRTMRVARTFRVRHCSPA